LREKREKGRETVEREKREREGREGEKETVEREKRDK
jgi:hypothetical protein